MQEESKYFKKCSTCKKEIKYSDTYYVCSISACRKQSFCSVTCWDVHQSVMNHRSAWAEEKVAPSRNILNVSMPSSTKDNGQMSNGAMSSTNSANNKRRRLVRSSSSSSSSSSVSTSTSAFSAQEVLIVASKLKAYIKAKHDLNTSQGVLSPLSDIVRRICDEACEKAKSSGRKTLLERDF